MEKNLTDMITYTVTDAYLADLKGKYLPLKVAGLDDKEGYAECNLARLEVKGCRVAVEKRRKELKSDSLEFGRKVDSEARRITDQLEEVEGHLKAQQDIIDNEKKRIREEALRKIQEETDRRVRVMQGYKADCLISELAIMSEDDFEVLELKAKTEFEASERKRAEEQHRLAELEAEREAQNEKLREQEAENKRLKDEMLAKQRAEIAEKEQQLQREREQKAIEEMHRKEAEDKKTEEEAKIKQLEAERRAKAEKKIADQKLFSQIQKKFPTIESAWVEIARLMKGTK